MATKETMATTKKKTLIFSLFSSLSFSLPNNHIQEAIRLKEAGHAEEVVVVSVGPKECQVRVKRFR